MELHLKGISRNITNPIIGKISKYVNQLSEYPALIDDLYIINSETVCCIITHYEMETKLPYIIMPNGLNGLSEGDIVVITKEGMLNIVYRVNSDHNCLLVTELCNNNCLMCSQPPKDRSNVESIFNINKDIILQIPSDCAFLGISGGEPTLLGSKFFELLKLTNKKLPETEIQVLTNGRLFNNSEFTNHFKSINTEKLLFGIPLYSDSSSTHNYIVQTENAFNETMLGLYNLAKLNIRIEIRVVLHKISVSRIIKLAEFIYHNLPFVEHVAFMGLENTGYTPYNHELLWIDPAEYMGDLSKAVIYLDRMGINVSLYNLQLCIMPEELREYACKSISDWKNIYLEICNDCSLKNTCGGFFLSNKYLKSKQIKSIPI